MLMTRMMAKRMVDTRLGKKMRLLEIIQIAKKRRTTAHSFKSTNI